MLIYWRATVDTVEKIFTVAVLVLGHGYGVFCGEYESVARTGLWYAAREAALIGIAIESGMKLC